MRDYKIKTRITCLLASLRLEQGETERLLESEDWLLDLVLTATMAGLSLGVLADLDLDSLVITV